MKVELKEVSIKELFDGYQEDDDNDNIVGYKGKLNIRPKYQREFVYEPEQQEAVIDTILKGFPLNVMYWAVLDDGNFEIIDGQQRTMSICRYLKNDFMFKPKGEKNPLGWDNLQDDIQEKIQNYKLSVYLCSGEPSEKLEWFKTVNIAGAELTDQELNNAVYSGDWITNAKYNFSKTGKVADANKDYLKGDIKRQDYLETVLSWISDKKIEIYMAKHQKDENATELVKYFENVIEWVKKVYLNDIQKRYRKKMKGVNFGYLYNNYKDNKVSPDEVEKEVSSLMQDDDVSNQQGIYKYIFTRDEKDLNLRAFLSRHKAAAYEKQKGICKMCKKHFNIDDMQGDHIKPWSKGGKTDQKNCQMLCKKCNIKKSNI